MNMRKLGLGVVLVTALALTVGVVSAQDGAGGPPPPPPPHRLPPELMELVTEATGLEPEEIREQVRGGMSLAELIEANGGDVDAVAAEAVSVITEHINERLANGVISQERAHDMLEHVNDAVERGLNFVPGEGGPGGRFPILRLRGAHHLLEVASEFTGLDEREIIEQLRGGATLADVLTEYGVDTNAFIDQIVADAEARLDEAISNGRVDEARAAEMLANLRAELEEHLDQGLVTEI
jgi:hypothetical protein